LAEREWTRNETFVLLRAMTIPTPAFLKTFVRGEQPHRSPTVALCMCVSVCVRLSHRVCTVRRDWTRNANVRAAARPLFGLTVKQTRNMSDVPMQDVRNRKVAGFAFWSKSSETFTVLFLLLILGPQIVSRFGHPVVISEEQRESCEYKNVSH